MRHLEDEIETLKNQIEAQERSISRCSDSYLKGVLRLTITDTRRRLRELEAKS